MNDKEKMNEVLEEQIGSMGGNIQDEAQNKPKTLGKLQHKAAYGEKEDLTDEEQKSKEVFLKKRVKILSSESSEPSPSEGWIMVDREEMGLRSMFYPASWNFYIRPATVNAIKNWTSVNEERADEVFKVFNDIIKTCVKIETSDISKPSWDQIRSWDRFWFILKIREYTFSTGETKIEFLDNCSECGDEIPYKLTSAGLYYDYPDESIIEKYWTGLRWEIDPTEYGLDHEPIILYNPTLGKDNAIIDWATNKVRNKQTLDETFLKYLIWLLEKPAKDMQMLDRQIQKIYNDYKKWDIDTFNFMTDVINNININQSEQLKTICPCCGREATSTVRFPNGIKELFACKSNIKKFGSK